MSQTPALISTLKKQLKARGKTYAHVASHLGMSEASIKRLFIEQSFSLQRLEWVCQMIDLQLSELMALMQKEQPQLQKLSAEQEQQLVDDTLLLMIAIYVMNGHGFEYLCGEIAISKTGCIQKLALLDRLRIIELLPNNRIKLRIAPNFHWQRNGPIQRFFQQHVEHDFFRCPFTALNEHLVVINAELSEFSQQEMQRKMDKFAQEFNALAHHDQRLPPSQRKNITVVLAARAWQFALFDRYRRKTSECPSTSG
ncbi:MAG: transcriptional regulator with XRE-family HTH domain [Candidatus Endobugula sp.]|jgi:transcriptional regulator with XRE-family HTH domain